MKHLKRFNENLGWQSLYDISGNSITQQYTFSGIDKATTFISESMKIFEKLNHHPDLLNWSGLKLLVSLKTAKTVFIINSI